jgi:predicted O-linked N-acetylglucosamine transferase (SPINDLY family)
LQKAAELLPDDAEAHNNYGNALRDCGRLDEAVVSYRRALEIQPDYAEIHNNLGNAQRDLGRIDDAVASYRRTLEIIPDYAEAHNNLGNVQRDLGRFYDAWKSYHRALEIRPDYAEVHNNFGNIQRDLGRFDDAVKSYRRALEIKPDLAEAHSSLLFLHNYQADQSAAMLLDESLRFGDLVARQAQPHTDWSNIPESARCLRVGLVSGDFGEHPVGYFVEGVLAELASSAVSRLELIAYATRVHGDAVTDRIKASCHEWHSAVALTDKALAEQIRDNGINILVDLSGHTAGNRLPMFAWKPAPVLVSWLGYFATTGVAAMDYLIADRWTVPEAEEAHFTEKIWRLPDTYLCFTPPAIDLQVAPPPALANGHITFGCFNNLTKMNDAVVALWARVLQAVPGSRLFLKTKQLGDAKVQQSVLSRFAACGIDARRLILERAAPRAELLATYHRVDIALDPFPYPGGTTSVEGLWMGVPMITKRGDRFLSHVGETIAHNAGLADWVASDEDDYVARAVAHASDIARLSSLRAGLRQQVLSSPLFDTARFARNFEEAMCGMWARWLEQRGTA